MQNEFDSQDGARSPKDAGSTDRQPSQSSSPDTGNSGAARTAGPSRRPVRRRDAVAVRRTVPPVRKVTHEETEATVTQALPPSATLAQGEKYVRWGQIELTPEIADALAKMGYVAPSEIQRLAIPPLLAGRDVVGQAVTGSGKTSAFGIPMCETVRPNSRDVEGLILVPTRELAQQVAKELSLVGSKLGVTVIPIYGGDPINRQIEQLERGAQVVVGTPGRVKDHMARHTLDLRHVRFAVLDEADEMLDIGFADDMEFILRHTPRSRQTALFSATIPGFILKLIRQYLDDPVWVKLVDTFDGVKTAAEVKQIYYDVAERDKVRAVREVLESMPDDAQTLMFRKMQVGVDRLARDLAHAGYPARGIHGGMSQRDRDRVMTAFRDGSLRILIATNVAARGLDISTVTYVINYDMPDNVEEYVHRVGRTARMGKQGTAVSFVGEHDSEIIEKVIQKVGEDVLEHKLLAIYGG
jgi:ATP-dependent RNA helicase DeaD